RNDAQRMVQAAVDTFGGIDVIVNVAGVLRVAPALELTDAQWDETFAVNVKGVFLGAQVAARVMVKQGRGGNIVNIASTAAVVPRIDQAAYCSSKAAVAHLTRCL